MLNEGREVRDYTLKQFLGRGGFGEVWLAEKKIEISDKKVPFALKFLAGGNQRITEYESVKREINTWIDASGNKNVVSVLDGFAHENYFVIVSEYANNGSLREWLRKNGGKAPNLETAVEMICGILDGLTHLHAQKIVHRDLKPENVLLKGDVPCIVDFGVSRVVETVSLTSSQLGTNSAGSPLYMSPESFERVKPSPQIDIWSAGVMLFEMLSGKTPYSGETIPALIFEIVTKEPRALPAEVPESIQRVAKKALAKELSERFSSAKEMRDDLMKAFYLRDTAPPVFDEAVASTYPQKNTDSMEVQTQPVQNIVQKESKKNNKLNPAWIGIGAGACLAAAIGILAIVLVFSRGSSSNQNNFVSNQPVNVGQNSNSNNISEAADVKTEINSQNSEKPLIQNTEKASNPTVESQTPAKSTPKKNTVTPKPKPKKSVTLDDLIGKE